MKVWIQAMRLRTLPLAASCILAGAASAKVSGLAESGERLQLIFWLTLATTFLLQVLSNFANDYGDFSHGVDNENRIGPKRTLQSGSITKSQMKRALLVTTVLTLLSGISLLWFAFSPSHQFTQAFIMLIIGFAAIAAAIKYTVGNNPYGYRGLGDLFVFLFFGPVGVVGTCYLMTLEIPHNTWLLAVTTGLYSTAVLNLNNLRDHENDRISGKRTLVVQWEFNRGKMYQIALVILATIALLIWVVLFGFKPVAWLAIIPGLVQCALLLKVWRCSVPAQLDSELKKVALLTFLISLILFLG
jgi:1,4-dihydroxy-2-naphthoate octaprenyltransferase